MAPQVWIPLAAFGLGSIPFGYLLYRARRGGDIRAVGSGNIGATNVLRSAGPGLGLLTLVLDAAKGAAAVLLARHWAPGREGVLALALLLAILGHLYTPWLRFQGGKGVATGLGAFAALAPMALLGALAVFAAVLARFRYVSLASIAACIALPLLLLLPAAGGTPALAVELAATAAAALIIVRHRANIARLRAGTEARLGSR